jgi:hypothetical protein
LSVPAYERVELSLDAVVKLWRSVQAVCGENW